MHEMDMEARAGVYLYRAGKNRSRSTGDADPVTTELVRNALNSAANQMKNTIVRTAFSPIVYEALDFCAALYDRDMCLLAQAPTLPIFLGTMGFCVEAAVAAVGGADQLEPGDVVLYNMPYGTGSHAQDAAIVMPIFLDGGELIGYVANKAHWSDIGAKNPYCTDTTDLFQEGVLFPGVKLYRRGELVPDIARIVAANTRMPKWVQGDVNAQVASARIGARALVEIVGRFGLQTFRACVDRMYDHGEAVVRSFFEKLPDGKYAAFGHLDNDGLGDDPIDFEIGVEIEGSIVRLDYSKVPDAVEGPLNCPLPSTVSASRVAIGMLVGEGVSPNEGHSRPIEILTRPGSIFHPVAPQPCYMYGWSLFQAMDAIYLALAKSFAGLVPSGSANDICYVAAYGTLRDSGEPFINGYSLPVGQGAQASKDGATMYITALAKSNLPSAEIQEAKFPILFKKWEFTTDSCGAGQFRGGTGWDYQWQVLQELRLISTIERTKVPSWGQQGGLSGTANRLVLEYPDGRAEEIRKVTGMRVPAGTVVKVHCGGGGGYGPPTARGAAAIEQDLAEGLISEGHVRQHYPHALPQMQSIAMGRTGNVRQDNR
jgi:N-methylhydantoinase B